MSHAVVLDQWQLPERPLVANLLAQQGGLPPPVAQKLAGRAAGIVWENAPPATAQVVVKGLCAHGYPARAIAQSHMPPATSPRRVHVLALDGEHLGVQLRYSGPPEWIAWNDVLAISAGAFKTVTTTTETSQVKLAQGMIVVEDQQVHVDIARDLVVEFFAVPLADRSRLVHIRLHSQEVNYAQTMGGTIHEGWRDKFCLLVAKLGLRAEQALVSPQTEALVACGMHPQQSAVNPYFENEEEFAAHNRWLLARKRAGV